MLVSGCGHAGIINTMQYAREITRPLPVVTAIGGFHLLNASEAQLSWTAKMMREFGFREFIGAHCTGINAVHNLREALGLSRNRAAGWYPLFIPAVDIFLRGTPFSAWLMPSLR